MLKNDDWDDLEKRKVYRVLVDPKAEKDGYPRVIDESGDDYLYPASYFVKLDCPTKQNKPLRLPDSSRIKWVALAGSQHPEFRLYRLQ